MTRRLVPLALVALLAAAANAADVRGVPRPQKWTVDETRTLTAAQVAELDVLGDHVRASGRGELAVVMLRTVGNADPHAFATDLFNHWGVGDASRDNGVLILVAVEDRAAEIILGEGIDSDENERLAEHVMTEQMVPRFRRGDFAGGIVAGARATADRILGVRERPAPQPAPAAALPDVEREDLPAVEAERPSPTPAAAPTPMPMPPPASAPPLSWLAAVPALLCPALGLAGLVAGAVALVTRHRRPPDCPQCGQPMTLLDEAADDAYLDAGQRLEEKLGSVDHRVFVCERDNHVERRASSAWFTGYSACPACGHKTLDSASTTLQHATHYSGGLVRIDETCAHCKHHRTSTRSTPPKPRPQSSSASRGFGVGSRSGSIGGGTRSSSRSFGGGRSAGRGASGRW